ncbi:MAG: (2Fe-2S)-binding protein [Dehalococcoidales bacterium]|nr:(2Fe-2S)-binding protein [Dehalococcoidales bacterium]
MEKYKLTINGKHIEAVRGMTVLEAANSAGIYIPTLCADPDLEPYGSCRLCVVEIEGMRGLPTSCTTPVTEGMVVHTETPAVTAVRKMAVELLIADHPADCLTCTKNQNCELQKVANYLGIKELRFPKTTRKYEIDTSNPFFDIDRNKCILCARCVRTCNEITCVGAIDLAFRGNDTKVATFGDKTLFDSICQSCGECMVRCPTGALALKEVNNYTHEVKTTCPYCGVGCSMILGVRNNKVVSVKGNREGASNQGKLCVKGRFGIPEFVNSPERLTTPLIKKNGKLEKASWDEAIRLIASKFSNYQPEEVAVVSSSRATNEANYITQKFARSALGTNNVDNCARV